jgi:hypothetical protein
MVNEDVELMTSTQYPLISGSTSVIFNVKGAVQVREMKFDMKVISRELTADRKPNGGIDVSMSYHLSNPSYR